LHDIWLNDWQNQREIERTPRMTAIYPLEYCRRFSGSLYWEASQAATSSGLYDSFALYFTLESFT